MQLVDTHCHLNFDAYDEDRDAVIERAKAAGVTRIIIPAVTIANTDSAVALAKAHPGCIFACTGIHPTSTADFTDDDIVALRAHAQAHAMVAIGEIGLDYYWDKSPVETQKRAFRAQLALAKELELPVIIHNRDASDDLMDMLEEWVSSGLPDSLRERPGVLHSFSAPPETAERALASGFCLGFTGPITFRKAEDLRRVVRSTPNERLLIETDGPFLTPEPFRGKRNEPAYVAQVVDRMAAIKGLPTDEMARITTENAERLFRI